MSVPSPLIGSEALAFPEPRLLADIGATFARLCIENVPGRFDHVVVLPCGEYASLPDLVRAYLSQLPAGIAPTHAAMAIANPVEGDRVRMTNRDWAFSITELQRDLGLATLLVVNNFTALAMALPRVQSPDRRQVGPGEPAAQGVIGLVGPGTGLGVSGLVPAGDRWISLATEGGHASFAPTDERELRVLRFAWQQLGHVSAERLVSGPGLELIHQALTETPGAPAAALPAAEIIQRALEQRDATCIEAIDCFCGMLGTVAANLALTLGATGGVFIGGGIVPRLGELFDRSSFRAKFEAKGRFSAYVARIPTYVLTAENLAFHGVSSLLAEHVPSREGSTPLLERVRAARETLSPAERRVADVVLENPRTVLNDAVAVIAQMAEVSQPTVIRFCRSLGFQGLTDFKLKLASGLTGTLPIQRTLVRREDATPDLCAKVLDNTISSIMHFRESLNVAAVDQAIEILRAARRVEFYALGNSSIVAQDAQHKLFRFRVPSVAHTDPTMLAMAADLLSPGDVAVFISSSGQPSELVRAATHAQERGAAVIAITANKSPLARKATVCIPVDHIEDSTTFVAMISRILHLLVVDMVSVGLAVRRSGSSAKLLLADPHEQPGPMSPAPGVLISHVN